MHTKQFPEKLFSKLNQIHWIEESCRWGNYSWCTLGTGWYYSCYNVDLPLVSSKINQEILSSVEPGEQHRSVLNVHNHILLVCNDLPLSAFYLASNWSFLRSKMSLSILRLGTCLELSRDCGALVWWGQDSCTAGQLWHCHGRAVTLSVHGRAVTLCMAELWHSAIAEVWHCAMAELWHCAIAEVWHCQCGVFALL